MPGSGVCDPHVRVFAGRLYMYATHDLSPRNRDFIMEDWWVWSSGDLSEWKLECTLRPEQTYIGRGFRSCWATDAAERDGLYYWYFSEGALRTGVVVSETPTGPWRNPLGEPLLNDGLVPVGAYDPGILIDTDGSAWIVFGVWEYYIARLADDMISLVEPPRRLTVLHPQGPRGPGILDDKPCLHRRNGLYYLSWGCFYGISENLLGPYECQGSIILEENVAEHLRYPHHVITHDRHGSFFEWKSEWYFACNDFSSSGNEFFRDWSLCPVSYDSRGLIEPVRLD